MKVGEIHNERFGLSSWGPYSGVPHFECSKMLSRLGQRVRTCIYDGRNKETILHQNLRIFESLKNPLYVSTPFAFFYFFFWMVSPFTWSSKPSVNCIWEAPQYLINTQIVKQKENDDRIMSCFAFCFYWPGTDAKKQKHLWQHIEVASLITHWLPNFLF